MRACTRRFSRHALPAAGRRVDGGNRAGVYRRTMVSNGPIAVTAVDTVSEPAAEPASGDAAAPAAGDAAAASRPLQPGSGTIAYEDGVIKFDSVPLVTPNGDVLVPALSFTVCSGQNVLVCGPNGCGKSSLFRTLGELWPLFGGRMTKPQGTKLFYIPQKPYLTLGTLRDQVIYPDTVEDMRARGMTDSDLQQLLSEVHLEYLAQRSGGWSAVQDWADVLSGGEKQVRSGARGAQAGSTGSHSPFCTPARGHGARVLPQAAVRHPGRVHQRRVRGCGGLHV